MHSQLTRGKAERVIYVECKAGDIDGADARIGWVRYSKSGRSVYYRGLTLSAIGGRGAAGNFIDGETGTEYWVSGIKKRGSNIHPAEPGKKLVIDEDARSAYEAIRSGADYASERPDDRGLDVS